MQTLVFTTSQAFQNSVESNSIIERFISTIEQMDAVKMEELLDEDVLFEGKKKWEILSEFRDRFDYIRNLGFSRLYRGTSVCKICNPGAEVISFKNILNGIHFGLAFKKENNTIIEITDCRRFDGFFKSLIPSQSTKYAIHLKKKYH